MVGLTDHDTTSGWEPAAEALPSGLTLIRGAEISCRWFGPGRPIGLHMLAYLFDPAYPAFADELARIRSARESRAERMVSLLRDDGVEIDWNEIHAFAAGGTVGRPHIAQALVRAGLVGSVSEAFASEWLGARYRVPKEDVEVFTALKLIREAGGVAVFAHPRASRRGPIVPDSLIMQLAAAGMVGIEADHEDHTPGEQAHVRRLARELGLAVTGSSDYHGANKAVRLGANLTAPEVAERIIATATGVEPIKG